MKITIDKNMRDTEYCNVCTRQLLFVGSEETGSYVPCGHSERDAGIILRFRERAEFAEKMLSDVIKALDYKRK